MSDPGSRSASLHRHRLKFAGLVGAAGILLSLLVGLPTNGMGFGVGIAMLFAGLVACGKHASP